MKTVCIIVILLAISSFSQSTTNLHSDEFFTIVTEIDPALAKKIVLLLLETDLAECMAMMRSIGNMNDPYITDIIAVLCESYPGQEKQKAEIILRLLLETVFDSSLSDTVLRERIARNTAGLDLLFRKFENFSDPILKGKIISLMPRVETSRFEATLMNEAFKLIFLMKQNHGFSSEERKVETLELLRAVSIIGKKEYLNACIEIMNGTASREIYERSKVAIKKIINN